MNALLALALLGVAKTASIHAVYVESRLTVSDAPSMESIEKTWIAPHQVRIESGNIAEIYDAKAGRYVVLHLAEKTWTVETHDELVRRHAIAPTAIFGITIDAATGGPSVPVKAFVELKPGLLHASSRDVLDEEVWFGIEKKPVAWSALEDVAAELFCGKDCAISDFFRQVRAIDGYPVRIDRRSGDVTLRSEVRRMESRDVAPSLFDVPEGFRKIER